MKMSNNLPGGQPQEGDFMNLDQLINQLNTDKQDYMPKPDAAQPFDNSIYDDPDYPAGNDEIMELTAEELRRKHESALYVASVTAKAIDNTLATGSCLIAKEATNQKYKATKNELEDLTDAWAQVLGEHNVIPPWLNLALLNLAIYAPKVKSAFSDRRMNILEEKQDAMVRQLQDLQEQIENLQKTKTDIEQDKKGNNEEKKSGLFGSKK